MKETSPMREQDTKEYQVLQAIPDDAAGIKDVQIKTWLATYVNEEHAITEDMIRERFGFNDDQVIQASIQRGKNKIEHSPYGVFVAKQAERIVGFASPTYDEDSDQQRLGALYVLPEAQGKGLGKQLLERALASLDNSLDVYLHVVTYNDAAIGFYERNGFVKTGKDLTGSILPFANGVYMPEIEMVKKAVS